MAETEWLDILPRAEQCRGPNVEIHISALYALISAYNALISEKSRQSSAELASLHQTFPKTAFRVPNIY